MNFPLHLQRFTFGDQSIDLLVPDAVAVREAYQKGLVSFPYWSQIWPAAKALAMFLLNNPSYTARKTVFELGAGLGLPSLMAARNATTVLCTDIAPEAMEAVNQSAAHLRLNNLKTAIVDWRCLPKDLSADVLLLSDINYEPNAFEALQKLIAAFLKNGTLILLSTPQRLMAKTFIAPLLDACMQQEEIIVVHDGKETVVTVMVLGESSLVH